MWLEGTGAKLADSTVCSNTAGYQGGGVYLEGSDATLIANIAGGGVIGPTPVGPGLSVAKR